MTDKETMKLALEFIERVNKDGWILADFEPQMYQAIAALKERLAQPEQEPVAWRETRGKVIKALAGIVNVHTPDKLFDLDAIPRDSVMVLVQQIRVAIDAYKPQRTWVGLTDEEFESIAKRKPSWALFDFYRLIEAKLKEKNQ